MTSKAFGLAQLGNVYDDGALSSRNLIINGAMQVAQRGTSSSSGGYSTADRYFHNLSGATSTMTREEATLGQEVDGQFEYWVKLNTTVGNNFCGIQQRVENVRSLRQGKATLSFWVKGTNPASGQYLVQIQRLPAGASGATLDTILSDTYSVSSTWTRKVFTFDVPALGTSVTETGNSQIYITLGSQEGTDTSTDAWELNITGVQLEVGDTATPFEHRSYGDELARCQRYFQAFNADNGTNTILSNGIAESSSAVRGAVPLLVQMRSTPSVSVSDITHFRIYTTGGHGFTGGAISGLSTKAMGVFATTGGSMTAGHAGQVLWDNVAGHVHADAEL